MSLSAVRFTGNRKPEARYIDDIFYEDYRDYHDIVESQIRWDRNTDDAFDYLSYKFGGPIAAAENIRRHIQCLLEEDFVEFGDAYYGVSVAARYILVAEAVNWAAKVIDYQYYQYKNLILYAATVCGGTIDWFAQDEFGNDVYYIYHKEVGTASFHQFWENGWEFDHGSPRKFRAEWSGWYRQDQAFDLLVDRDLLKLYAWGTRPRALGYPPQPEAA